MLLAALVTSVAAAKRVDLVLGVWVVSYAVSLGLAAWPLRSELGDGERTAWLLDAVGPGDPAGDLPAADLCAAPGGKAAALAVRWRGPVLAPKRCEAGYHSAPVRTGSARPG